MSSSLDLSLYTNLTKESFTLVEPTLVIAKEPSFFIYSEDLGLLLCSTCRYFLLSISPRALREHLSEFHPLYYTSKIKGVKDSPIIASLASLEAISLRSLSRLPSNTYYFKDLEITFNSYFCKVCSYITISLHEFRRHVAKTHDNTVKGKAIDRAYLLANLPIQYLYTPLKLGPFIPKLPELASLATFSTLDSSTTSNIEIETPSKRRALIKDYNLESEAYNSSLIKNTSIREIYGFIYFFKIDKFIKDKDIPLLLEDVKIDSLLKSTSRDNRYLVYLRERTYIIYNNASNKIESFPPSSRNRLVYNPTKELNDLAYEFSKHKSSRSNTTYFRELARFIIYLVRLYKARENLVEEEENNNYEPELSSITNSIILLLLEYRDKALAKELSLEEEEEIDRLIVRLVYSILNTSISYTTLNTSTFKNPLITYYILRNINDDLSFKNPTLWRQLGTILVYNLRLTVIALVSLNEIKAKKLNKSFNLEDEFNRLYKETLDYNINKSYKELYRIYIYIRRYIYNRTSIRNPIIEIDENSFLINNSLIKIDSLRSLYSSLLERLESLLYNHLLFFTKSLTNKLLGVTIPLESLSDDLSFITPNKSLLDNSSFLPYKDLYLDLALDRGSIINQYFLPRNPPKPTIEDFNKSKLKEYTLIRDSFIKLLFITTYLFIGSPTRGTEISIIRYINSIEFPRNIFLDPTNPSVILINLAWSKNRDITRIQNENIRILPRALSRVYIYYLTLVVPFYNFIKRKYYNIIEISPYIFEINNKILDSTLLSNLLAKETSKALDIKKGLTLSPLRDLLIYIISSRITDKDLFKSTSSSKDYRDSSIEDILANHSSKTREENYGRTTDLFSNTTRSILYRSKALSTLYFHYFKIDTLRDLLDIVELETSLSLTKVKNLAKEIDLDLELEKRYSLTNSSTLATTRERRLNSSSYNYNEDINSLSSSSNSYIEEREEEEEIEELEEEREEREEDIIYPSSPPYNTILFNASSPLTIREKDRGKNKEIVRSTTPTLLSRTKRDRAITLTKSPKIVKKARELVIELPLKPLNYNEYRLVEDKASSIFSTSSTSLYREENREEEREEEEEEEEEEKKKRRI
jgi:hypothetical protein